MISLPRPSEERNCLMKLLPIYRFALVLMTFALVAVSVAYVREHQEKAALLRKEARWQVIGKRFYDGHILRGCIRFGGLEPQYYRDYCDQAIGATLDWLNKNSNSKSDSSADIGVLIDQAGKRIDIEHRMHQDLVDGLMKSGNKRE